MLNDRKNSINEALSKTPVKELKSIKNESPNDKANTLLGKRSRQNEASE